MNRLMLALALLGLAASGCAHANLTVLKPLPAPVRMVAIQFNDATGAQLRPDESASYQSILTNHLAEGGIVVAAPNDAGAATARATFETFDPGSRALRYGIGFGAGTGELNSVWEVMTQTGEVIGACRIDGSISVGVFGGSFDEVLDKSADRLQEFLNGKTQ